MLCKHETVKVFPSHVEAETAVLELQKAGFDMQKISIIGKDYQTTEHIRGFLTWKDTAKAGAGEAGYWGSFFGGLFGILTGGWFAVYSRSRPCDCSWTRCRSAGRLARRSGYRGCRSCCGRGVGRCPCRIGNSQRASPEVRDRNQSW
ncbi:general stress protein [Nostoc sp.]|uniref:general stress protein n=1 Tax=Nostoc sp. TaxID=1180 RepID=UPI002FFA6598